MYSKSVLVEEVLNAVFVVHIRSHEHIVLGFSASALIDYIVIDVELELVFSKRLLSRCRILSPSRLEIVTGLMSDSKLHHI